MSEIVKTEAVVLSKINYGDTSSIVSLFTEDSGKISAIIKGGRNPKSKLGNVVDPLNHLQIIFYNKENRELQLLSEAENISHFPRIKENLETLKYSFAVIELVKNLSADSEPNKKVFKGLVRILSLFNSSNEPPGIIFGRFFLFYLSEIGYRLELNKCSVCDQTELINKNLGYSNESGLLCNKCKNECINNYEITPELFNYLICLKNNYEIENSEETVIKSANNFFEFYLKNHIPDFKGIQSLKSF
jgi:DNA repair protein RecO (recombination protein O)